MAIDPHLARTLDMVAEAAIALREPWWIIGSAAAVLSGLQDQVADVDLLVNEADARRLLQLWNAEPTVPSPSPLFTSTLFARLTIAPLPIEVMADLHVRGQRLAPATRMAVRWGDGALYVPDPPEQIAILERFGRD